MAATEQHHAFSTSLTTAFRTDGLAAHVWLRVQSLLQFEYEQLFATTTGLPEAADPAADNGPVSWAELYPGTDSVMPSAALKSSSSRDPVEATDRARAFVPG
jgi:hypothetical protein